MSEPLILLSSAAISEDDFITFLTGIGGVHEPGDVEIGRFSRDRCHLWIFLNPQALAESLEDIGAAATEKLGGAPQSCVVLELSREPGTERLALEFSIAFAERWPAVLNDTWDMLLTLPDMRQALREGKKLGVSE
jgi:hypothetical protein